MSVLWTKMGGMVREMELGEDMLMAEAVFREEASLVGEKAAV